MAQQNTISRSVGAYSITSTISWQQSIADPNKYFAASATNGQVYKYFDFTAMPANATILDVQYSYNYQDTVSGSGYQTIRQGSSPWREATKSNIKAWLELGNRNITILTSYKADTGMTSATKYNGTRKVINGITITVTYMDTAGNTIRYANGGNWTECEIKYADGGNWIKCKAYYGVDGQWKEC